MEIAILVLSLIFILGFYSIFKASKKNKIVKQAINSYLKSQKGSLVRIEKPYDSGPFDDPFFDKKGAESYQNFGSQSKETLYRKVMYKNSENNDKIAWLQLRLEKLKPTYTDWKEEA